MIKPEDIIQHEEQINTILIQIKPGIYDHFFKKHTKEMMKNYFRELRNKEK